MPTKDSSSSFTQSVWYINWRTDLGPKPDWAQYGSPATYTLTRTRTGSRLPKWHKIIEEGGNATTDLDATLDTMELVGAYQDSYVRRQFGTSDIFYESHARGPWIVKNGLHGMSHVDPAISSSFVDNLALAKFYGKLHGLERQFQGYVFAGELAETLHMLKKPAAGLQDLAKDFLGLLRKRKKANPKGWMKDLGGLWLENSFGWQPLINDCKAAIADWHSKTNPDPETLRISAGAKKNYDRTAGWATSLDVPGNYQSIGNGPGWTTVYAVLMEKHAARYRGALISRVEAPRWQDETLFGFQPKEFVPAAWELLPWSFLIDYFTNIGDILDASVTSTRNLAYLNKSTIRTTLRQRVMQLWPDAPIPSSVGWHTVYAKYSRVNAVLQRKVVSRRKNVGYSLPTLQFNFSLSDGQLGNCAALLSQANALHPQRSPRAWHR